MAKGIVEVVVGTVVLRQGKADPRDATAVDEVIYITPSGARHCVDRDGNDVTDIWDVIRAESKRAEKKGRTTPKRTLRRRRSPNREGR